MAELAGDYRPLDGGYPRLALEADGTYQFDTGVRCLRAPCPSGDAGTWRLRWGSTLYLVANTPDALEPQRFLDIVSTDPLTLVVEGAGGEARELAKFVEAPAAASCAAVLCAAGRRCEIVDGAAQCVP